MQTHQYSRSSLCLVLALSGPSWLTLGCSGQPDRANQGSAESEASAGRMSLALTARGASGTLYRLRQASLQVVQQGGFGFAFLSSENDPQATTLEATLTNGTYTAELAFGWFLEKVENGAATPVVATLLSSPLQSFEIHANQETFVSYRFETNGEVLDFGQGRLVIDIQVDEGAPPGTGGDALQIVDGLISPGSNPHGIQAVLFTAIAPVGATLELGSSTGSVCVSGDIDQVIGDDFTTQWGSTFGLFFLSDTLEVAPWDRDAGRVRGFSFTVTGSDIPPIRFNALPVGADPGVDIFCSNFQPLSGEHVAMPFGSLTFQCWAPGGVPLPGGDLQNITWSVLSDQASSHRYDFCLSDLRPLL